MKKLALVLYGIAVVALIYWVSTGAYIFTQSQKMVTEVDPLLGTTSQHWVNDYHPGLDLMGPVAAGFVVIGFAVTYFGRRKRKAA